MKIIGNIVVVLLTNKKWLHKWSLETNYCTLRMNEVKLDVTALILVTLVEQWLSLVGRVVYCGRSSRGCSVRDLGLVKDCFFCGTATTPAMSRYPRKQNGTMAKVGCCSETLISAENVRERSDRLHACEKVGNSAATGSLP